MNKDVEWDASSQDTLSELVQQKSADDASGIMVETSLDVSYSKYTFRR